MNIGILALQGAFIEHKKVLDLLGIKSFEIRQKKDLHKNMDGLILPGGESTTQGKLLNDLNLSKILKEKIENGLPTLGTCAGLILMAKRILGDSNVYLESLPVTVKRNAYGRQLGSFYTESSFGTYEKIPMTFIRAPYISSVSPDVKIMSVVNGNITGVKYKNQIAVSFHPELNTDLRIHKEFLNLI